MNKKVKAPQGYHWMKAGSGYKLMKNPRGGYKAHKGSSLMASFKVQMVHSNAKKKGKVLGRRTNLNEITKSKIIQMKSENIGLKKIAAETRVAVKTVRNFLSEVA